MEVPVVHDAGWVLLFDLRSRLPRARAHLFLEYTLHPDRPWIGMLASVREFAATRALRPGRYLLGFERAREMQSVALAVSADGALVVSDGEGMPGPIEELSEGE